MKQWNVPKPVYKSSVSKGGFSEQLSDKEFRKGIAISTDIIAYRDYRYSPGYYNGWEKYLVMVEDVESYKNWI